MTIFVRKKIIVIIKKQGNPFKINVWGTDLEKIVVKSKLFIYNHTQNI